MGNGKSSWKSGFSAKIALLVVGATLVLMSGIIAKACGPSFAVGCDINCTVQTIACSSAKQPCTTNSDCGQSCVLRTCEQDVCDPSGDQCLHPHQVFSPCGGCVANACNGGTCGTIGCSGLSECCVAQ